jgi:hypothetical protein
LGFFWGGGGLWDGPLVKLPHSKVILLWNGASHHWSLQNLPGLHLLHCCLETFNPWDNIPAFSLRRESACSKPSSVPLMDGNINSDLHVGFLLFIIPERAFCLNHCSYLSMEC